MKTMLNADGQIGIPEEVRQVDHLAVGDSFELERLTPGRYLLSRQEFCPNLFRVLTAEDGLPVIRVEGGPLTSRL